MKNIILYSILLLIVGCYEDKGNYEYTKINSINIELSPKTKNDGLYQFSQPPKDTVFKTISPIITQSVNKGDDNLEFMWIFLRIKGGVYVKDTVYQKDYTFKLAPKTKTSLGCIFVARDTINDISTYKQIKVLTLLPYTNSWFVIHGDKGKEKVGAIEKPTIDDEGTVSLDAYEDLFGETRFAGAKGLIYSNQFFTDWQSAEGLSIIGQDSLWSMYPFDMLIKSENKKMLPSMYQNSGFKFGLSNNRFNIIIDNNGKILNGKAGFLYRTKNEEKIANYNIDMGYLSEAGVATLYDRNADNILYYEMYHNSYGWQGNRVDENYLNAELKAIPRDLKDELDLNNNTVEYMGFPLKSSLEENGTCIILKNKTTHKYSALDLSYGKGNDKDKDDEGGDNERYINITKSVEMKNVSIDDKSKFATTTSFNDQIFYTSSNAIYKYNIINHDNNLLYSVNSGQTIKDIKFRVSYKIDQYFDPTGLFPKTMVAVVENADGSNEVHEIFFENSGDISEIKEYKGFGNIKDLVFSLFVRREL